MLKTSLRPRARPDTLDTSPTPVAPDIPIQVAQAATRRASYDPLEPVLLGTLVSQDMRRALLRLPNGRVTRVGVGDDISGRRVVAIGETRIYTAADGAFQELVMPHG